MRRHTRPARQNTYLQVRLVDECWLVNGRDGAVAPSAGAEHAILHQVVDNKDISV